MVFFRDDTLYFRAIQQGLKCQHKCQEPSPSERMPPPPIFILACSSESGPVGLDVWGHLFASEDLWLVRRRKNDAQVLPHSVV